MPRLECPFPDCGAVAKNFDADMAIALFNGHLATHTAATTATAMRKEKLQRPRSLAGMLDGAWAGLLAIKQGRGEKSRMFAANVQGKAAVCAFSMKCGASGCDNAVDFTDVISKYVFINGLQDDKIKKEVLGWPNLDECQLSEAIVYIEEKEMTRDAFNKETINAEATSKRKAKDTDNVDDNSTAHESNSSDADKMDDCDVSGEDDNESKSPAHDVSGEDDNECKSSAHDVSSEDDEMDDSENLHKINSRVHESNSTAHDDNSNAHESNSSDAETNKDDPDYDVSSEDVNASNSSDHDVSSDDDKMDDSENLHKTNSRVHKSKATPHESNSRVHEDDSSEEANSKMYYNSQNMSKETCNDKDAQHVSQDDEAGDDSTHEDQLNHKLLNKKSQRRKAKMKVRHIHRKRAKLDEPSEKANKFVEVTNEDNKAPDFDASRSEIENPLQSNSRDSSLPGNGEVDLNKPEKKKSRQTKIWESFGALANQFNGAIWEDFVKYCSDNLIEDPLLAQPYHVKDFIVELFEEEASLKHKNRSNPLLENYPNFYQANVINICKHLGFYLKLEFKEGSLVRSDPIKALLKVFHCLDQKLIEPNVNMKTGDLDLIKRLIPKYWYINHNTNSNNFWKQKLVCDVLTDVENKVLTEGEAAWELGVTPDMLACAVNRFKRKKQDLSLTIKEYIERGFGSEESFWEETSTELLVEDIRNRVVDVDSAAFQLGASFSQVMKKVGRIKTALEVKEEKDRILVERAKEKRANAPPKVSQLEFQISLAEKSEATLTEYEKMRLANMRERMALLNTLEIAKDKKAFKVSQPRNFKPKFYEPRQKSSRIKSLAEKQEKIQMEESFDAELDRLTPLWVGKRTPVTTVELSTDPTEKITWEIVDKKSETLSPNELSSIIPVPAMAMAATDLIVSDNDYAKSTRFIQRLDSEIKYSLNEEKLRETVDISNWIHAGTGKVSNDEIISLGISEELIAFGDRGGGLGFWLGEKSLLFRPHSMAVCRTVFAGHGSSTRVLTASHDGTVRSYDAHSQTFQLAFSWNKFYSYKQGVVWLELLDENSMLLNCEEGDVLNVDRRDRQVNKVLSLPKSRRSVQSQILISERQEKAMCQKGKILDKSLFGTPALVGSNISIHPTSRNLISLCNDETVVIYDRRNCQKPISCISTFNNFEETTLNSKLSHHCGSSWSHSGNHFLTYERGHRAVLQGSVNLYSHHQLTSGDVPEKLSPKLPKYFPVFAPGQGIVWSPWQDDVYYFIANNYHQQKNWLDGDSVVVGMDVHRGAVAGVLNLPMRAPSMFGVHPTRQQLILANVNETGDVVIYKEEQK